MSSSDGFTPVHKHSKSVNSSFQISPILPRQKKKNNRYALNKDVSISLDDDITKERTNSLTKSLKLSTFSNLNNSINMYNAPTDLRGGIVSFQSMASLKEMKTEVNRSCCNPIQNMLPLDSNDDIKIKQSTFSDIKIDRSFHSVNIIDNINEKWNKVNKMIQNDNVMYIGEKREKVLKSKRPIKSKEDFEIGNYIDIGENYYIMSFDNNTMRYYKTEEIYNKSQLIEQYTKFMSDISNSINKPIVLSKKQINLIKLNTWKENIEKNQNDSFNYYGKHSKNEDNISHSSLSLFAVRPNKKWDSNEMYKENIERINYVIQKRVIVSSTNNRRIQETYNIEYDEPVAHNKPSIKKANWNLTNDISYIDDIIIKASNLIKNKNVYRIERKGNFDIIAKVKKDKGVLKLWKTVDFVIPNSVRSNPWIYDYNVFIYNENNHNNTYYEKIYQLKSNSERDNKDEINYRSIYHNIPLSFTISGKKIIKKYKIDNQNNDVLYLPIIRNNNHIQHTLISNDEISLSYQGLVKSYEEKATDMPIKSYEDKETNASIDILKQSIMSQYITKWNKKLIPMVQYSFHYKLEQGAIDIRNILKRWKQKIVPIRTLHYSTKGIVKPTWNILNLIHNQDTVNIKSVKTIKQKEQQVFTVGSPIIVEFISKKFLEMENEERQRIIKEQCIRTKEEIEKMKRDLLENLNINIKEEEQKPKKLLKSKKKPSNTLNKSSNLTSPPNKEDAKDNSNNESQMNKTAFKGTKEKKKLTDSVYKGQSFNFNIYTKGLGIQSIKTTMPKENNNK